MRIDSLDRLLESGDVLRCHTLKVLNRQTVGLHTWRALVLLHWIYAPKYPPSDAVYAMLFHDAAEVYTGDMPGNAKASSLVISAAMDELEQDFNKHHELQVELGYIVGKLITFCDRIDLALYSLEEGKNGNRRMIAVAKKALEMAEPVMKEIHICAIEIQIHERIQTLYDRIEQEVKYLT